MFTQREVQEMAKAVGAMLGEACNARDELDNIAIAVQCLLQNFDGEFMRINVESDTGCPDCTEGVVPDRLNTGLCAFHVLVRFVKSRNLDLPPL